MLQRITAGFFIRICLSPLVGADAACGGGDPLLPAVQKAQAAARDLDLACGGILRRLSVASVLFAKRRGGVFAAKRIDISGCACYIPRLRRLIFVRDGANLRINSKIH